MTRSEQTRWNKLFFENMLRVNGEIEWVMKATTLKTMANRIGVISPWTRQFLLYYVMPSGLKKGIIKKGLLTP